MVDGGDRADDRAMSRGEIVAFTLFNRYLLPPEIVVEQVVWSAFGVVGCVTMASAIPSRTRDRREAIGVQDCRTFGFVVRVVAPAGHECAVG